MRVLDGFAPATEMAMFDVLVEFGMPLRVSVFVEVPLMDIQFGMPFTVQMNVSVAFVELAITVAVYEVPMKAVGAVEVVTESVGAELTVMLYVRVVEALAGFEPATVTSKLDDPAAGGVPLKVSDVAEGAAFNHAGNVPLAMEKVKVSAGFVEVAVIVPT